MTALVLIHGFTGAPASWDGVVAELPARSPPRSIHRVRVLGHDGGPLELSRPGFQGEVDRIAAELRQAGLDAIHLVGYSLGGRLALGLLATHPELLARVTLIGARNGLPAADLAARAARRAEDARWSARLADGLPAFASAWEAQPLLATPGLPAAARARERAIRLAHDPRGLALALATLGLAEMPDYGAALAARRGRDVPTTLVVGAADARFLALAAELRAHLPHAALRSIAGAGHNVLTQAPAALAALLTSSEEQTTPTTGPSPAEPSQVEARDVEAASN
ncbi:MAG: alpha/beta fold hydrolase [Deltaproteobacteria bacterium]|nr:alpha/beta fold hydrolase [Deltaproteobacteria bacterium]